MKILNYIVKIILSLFILLLIAYSNLISSLDTSPNVIKYIYPVVTILFILFIIYSNIKKLPLYIFIIIPILWFMFISLPGVNSVFDKDYCLDSSICAEGLELNTEYGLIKINKENCLKYHWKWDEKSRYCNMRSENK